jgi:hypothetical protein
MSTSLQSLLTASAASSLLRNTVSAAANKDGFSGLSTANNIGASLLSASLATSVDGPAVESAAVRVAKAQFTAPYVSPPWLNAKGESAANPSLSAVKALKSLIDPKIDSALPPDLSDAFTTYRGLERMRVFAEAASNAKIGAGERADLTARFQQGLTELRKFLGTVTPDKLNLYFEAPSRVATTSPIRQGSSVTSSFLKGAVDTRTAALTSLDSVQSIALSVRKGTAVYPVLADLTQIVGTVTLDKVAKALNDALAVHSAKDSNGNPLLDGDGKPISILQSKFTVKSENGKWGLAIQSVPNEAVWSVPQQDNDSLMVVGSQVSGQEVAALQVRRIDDFAAQTRPRLATTVTAIDSHASARARLASSSAKEVAAPIEVVSAATDADGGTYLLGTTAGAVDNVAAAGAPEMFIRKVSASGALLWQRPIDTDVAASAAAIAIGKDGKLVVTGSVIGGAKETQSGDSNIFVARFDLNGAELSRTTLQLPGDQRATAVAADANGNTFVTARIGVSGGGVYKFSAEGKLLTSVTSQTNRLTAVQIAPDSSVVVLGRASDGTSFVERLDGSLAATGNMLSLSDLQPADMIIAEDGTIGLSGTVYKAGTSDKDVIVSLIDSDMVAEQRIILGTPGADEADSLIYKGGAIYVAGRTSGDLDGTRSGTVDGFVSRIDVQTGAITETLQFGRPGATTGPVVLASTIASSAALESIGLGSGLLTPTRESRLIDTTRLRAGDSFQLKLNAGKISTISIEAGDTLSTLADRIRKIMGKSVTVTATNGPGGMTMRLQPTTGNALQVIAGPAGSDALEKLGMKASRLFAPPLPSTKDPKVKPGGQFGLALSDSLTLSTQDDAKAALAQIKSALSMTQTAYRSLYWNESMRSKVEGLKSISSAQSSQLQQYRAAIARLGG